MRLFNQPELLLEIFSFLAPHELKAISLVCKLFTAIADPLLTRNIVLKNRLPERVSTLTPAEREAKTRLHGLRQLYTVLEKDPGRYRRLESIRIVGHSACGSNRCGDPHLRDHWKDLRSKLLERDNLPSVLHHDYTILGRIIVRSIGLRRLTVEDFWAPTYFFSTVALCLTASQPIRLSIVDDGVDGAYDDSLELFMSTGRSLESLTFGGSVIKLSDAVPPQLRANRLAACDLRELCLPNLYYSMEGYEDTVHEIKDVLLSSPGLRKLHFPECLDIELSQTCHLSRWVVEHAHTWPDLRVLSIDLSLSHRIECDAWEVRHIPGVEPLDFRSLSRLKELQIPVHFALQTDCEGLRHQWLDQRLPSSIEYLSLNSADAATPSVLYANQGRLLDAQRRLPRLERLNFSGQFRTVWHRDPTRLRPRVSPDSRRTTVIDTSYGDEYRKFDGYGRK